MPIVSIDADWLQRLLGREHPVEELAEALEQIGCDVEDVVELDRFRCPSCGAVVEASLGAEVTRSCGICGHESETGFEGIGTTRAIRLDLLAARPDLFDVGGIARALKGFLGETLGLPGYRVERGEQRVLVDPSVHDEFSFRPHIRCAVVTMPPIDEAALISIMKLQEALHWGVGRDRKLASIGVYDMATLEGDIHYRTMDPDREPFHPLGLPTQEMSGREILAEHPKGRVYAKLLADQKRYPLLIDDRGQVLSMPPVINSDETKLQLGSTRLFVDVTGPSEAAVVKSLDTLVSSMIELGGTAESVEIVDGDRTLVCPDLDARAEEIDRRAAERWLGFPLGREQLENSLRKMRLDVEALDERGGRFRVVYPAFRTDIKHMVDVFEDLAIGYGYARIEPRTVRSMTVGHARPEEQTSERVRSILVGLGYTEIMSLPMTTEQRHFLDFREPVPDAYPRVANPKLKALTVVRTHLMTGLLESLRENRRQRLPLQLFELDNVVALDEAAETGTREERHVAIVEMGRDAGYASIRAVVDSLLFELGADGRYEAITAPAFVEGRAACVASAGILAGRLGELHPEVLTGFGLDHPVALAELKLARIV